jgi:multimeric flavodoxin WrbA
MFEMVKVNIIGISGSPRKRGNTEILIREALDAASKLEDVKVETILLSKTKIEPCKAEQLCWKKKVPRCLLIKDDMEDLYPKLMNSDGIIIGTPVYFGTISGQLKTFLDRTTCLGGVRKLENKVGAAIAVGAIRHGGQEFAMGTIHNFFLVHGMFVVSQPPYGYWGVGAKAADPGSITSDKWPYRGKIVTSLEMARNLGERVVEATKIVKRGLQ